MSKATQANAVIFQNFPIIRICLGISIALVAFSTSQASYAADASSAKQIIKIVTPSGKIIYTDRELSNTPAGRVQPLTGGQILASETSIKSPVTAASSPASSTVPKGSTLAASAASGNSASKVPTSLVEFAAQQEASLKAQEKALKEVQATVEKSNCENARKNIQSLQGRVTRFNEKGEKEILDDAQMAQEKVKIEQQITQYCK